MPSTFYMKLYGSKSIDMKTLVSGKHYPFSFVKRGEKLTMEVEKKIFIDYACHFDSKLVITSLARYNLSS